MSSYKLTPEGLKPEDSEAREATQADIDKLIAKLTKTGQAVQLKLNTVRIGEPEERNKCPEAYLLSVKEAELIARVQIILAEVNAPYIKLEAEGTDITKPEIQNTILVDYFTTFKAKRIPIKKLQSIIDKAKNAPFWMVDLSRIEMGGKKRNAQYYTVRTSTPDTIPEFDITYDTHRAFFEADNVRDKAKAINIPDLYRYTTYSEIRTIHYLAYIIKRWNNPDVDKKELIIKSAPEFDMFFNLGTEAITNAKTTNKVIPIEGQISVTEILANNGVKLEVKESIEEIVTFKNPNADKLLKQVMDKALKSKQPVVQITLDEFMDVRKLKDRKEAYKQLKKASADLRKTTIKLNGTDIKTGKKAGKRDFEICIDRYVQERNGKQGGYVILTLHPAYYADLIANKQVVKAPIKLLEIPNNKANSYFFACKFVQRKRMRNNNIRELDNRLSVKTLLDVSTLPLYKDLKDKGQFAQRIVTPFVKALDYLEEIELLSYVFVKHGGEKLTDKELNDIYDNYAFFEDLCIDVTWFNEPDYKNLNEQRQKRADKQAKAEAKALKEAELKKLEANNQ